ncbi:UPF0692 protein CG33108 [Adelges cooleyi]|uniref:UPF0692 protein CG33108 n=1 Tax=Adelges cooleyi TaxID=133065 RepID=UPI00217F9D48|nr:UPF0692 protein CG33108 [Adelges cooleyi]
MSWFTAAEEALAEIKKTWRTYYPCHQTRLVECRITPLKAMKQIGPTCGLVALCMAEPLMDLNESQTTIDLMYKEAKKRGFTKLGEMFFMSYMYEMADLFLADTYTICHVNQSMSKDTSLVKKLLKEDCLLIVCYDDDKNMMPTVNQGHTAHWAIICGIIGEDHVIARHGKKSKYGIWSLADLAASNDGLIEVKHALAFDSDQYVIPENGDLQKTLASQFMVLKPKTTPKVVRAMF